MNQNGKIQHGFKVPNDYFDGLEKELLEQRELSRLIEDGSFTVPQGYFENVENKIFEKITVAEKGKIVPLFKKSHFLWAAAGIAACIAIVISIFGTNEISFEEQFAALELEEISNYLNSGNMEISPRDVSEYFNQTEIQELSLSETLFDTENLEEYLFENIDESLLVLE